MLPRSYPSTRGSSLAAARPELFAQCLEHGTGLDRNGPLTLCGAALASRAASRGSFLLFERSFLFEFVRIIRHTLTVLERGQGTSPLARRVRLAFVPRRFQ